MQSFTLRQQAATEINQQDHSITACLYHIYIYIFQGQFQPASLREGGDFQLYLVISTLASSCFWRYFRQNNRIAYGLAHTELGHRKW